MKPFAVISGGGATGDSDPPVGPFADQCRAALEKMLAKGITVMLLLGEHETNSDDKSVFTLTPVPVSYSLVRGLILRAAETFDVYYSPTRQVEE